MNPSHRYINISSALIMNERSSKQQDVAEAARNLVVDIKGTIDAVRKFESQLLEKAQLLVPKKEGTEALVDQISESRKRKREEEEEPVERKEMKQVAVKVHVPTEKMCFVAGKFYSNRERLERKYQVRVYIPEKGGEVVELRGRADRVAAAKEDILTSLPVDLTRVVSQKFIGSIIGRNGEMINKLRRRHKIKIQIRNDVEVEDLLRKLS